MAAQRWTKNREQTLQGLPIQPGHMAVLTALDEALRRVNVFVLVDCDVSNARRNLRRSPIKQYMQGSQRKIERRTAGRTKILISGQFSIG